MDCQDRIVAQFWHGRQDYLIVRMYFNIFSSDIPWHLRCVIMNERSLLQWSLIPRLVMV